MLEKEKVWILIYIASRTLAAKPVLALAAWFPAKKPRLNVAIAIMNMNAPYL